MRIQLLKSSVDDYSQCQFLTSYLVDDRLAIDAGSLGFLGDLERQFRVRDVFITHTHIDHIASLPIFLENSFSNYMVTKEPVHLHASEQALECLQQHMFNDLLWPDFFEIARSEIPFLQTSVINPGETKHVQHLKVRAIEVDHVVPTQSYLLDDGAKSVLIVSDTGPTEEVWRIAREQNNLQAVFLEATFPDRMDKLAVISKHLTPESFVSEVEKVSNKDVPVFAVHLKANNRLDVVTELSQTNQANIQVATPGHLYEF